MQDRQVGRRADGWRTYDKGGLVYLNYPSRHREKSDLTVNWNLLSFRDREISGSWTVVFREMAEHRYFFNEKHYISANNVNFCELCEKDARFQKGGVIFANCAKKTHVSQG